MTPEQIVGVGKEALFVAIQIAGPILLIGLVLGLIISIFQAVTDLYADRIGHGTYLLTSEAISDQAIVNKEEYVERLGEYVADRRITLEVCLTSNLQTNPGMKSFSDHTFGIATIYTGIKP